MYLCNNLSQKEAIMKKTKGKIVSPRKKFIILKHLSEKYLNGYF